MQTVRTQLTRRDICHVVFVLLTRPAQMLRGWLVMTVILGAALFVWIGLPRDVVGVAVGVVVAALVSVFAVVFSSALTFMRMTFALNRAPGVLGAHEFTLHPDGLLERTAVNESLIRWQAIRRVYRLRGYLFIELSQSAFHVIPDHSFGSEAQATAFCQAVARRRSADPKS